MKSDPVGASQGTTISVSSKDSALLAGTSLEIPASSLPQDTVITLEVGMESMLDADTAAGPVAIWGPAGTKFNKPARMTLPVTLGESSDEITVLVREADGTQFELGADKVTLDAQGRATFTIDGFTSFQPMRRRPCMADSQCATGSSTATAAAVPRATSAAPTRTVRRRRCASRRSACSAAPTARAPASPVLRSAPTARPARRA